jgi:hypothetical protein
VADRITESRTYVPISGAIKYVRKRPITAAGSTGGCNSLSELL